MQARVLFAAAAVMIGSIAAAPFALASPGPGGNPAGTPGASDSSTSAKPGHGPDEVVCKYVEQTGTHLGGSKHCMTRAQWDEYTRMARENVESLQQNGNLGGPPH